VAKGGGGEFKKKGKKEGKGILHKKKVEKEERTEGRMAVDRNVGRMRKKMEAKRGEFK